MENIHKDIERICEAYTKICEAGYGATYSPYGWEGDKGPTDITIEPTEEPTTINTNEIHSFLTSNAKPSSTETVVTFIEKYAKELENSANLETLLYGLYSFAEMKGYREGMSAGRDIGAGRAIPPSSIKK